MIYETVADVPETWVWWRADFQSASRVFKEVFWTFSYLYLWHTVWFHAKKLLKTLKFWKSLNLLCKSGSRPKKLPKKSPKNRSLNCDLLKFLNTYGIFWVPPGESSYPDSSKCVWQRGVERLKGRVTDGRSWPLFQLRKKYPRRCSNKCHGRNFDFRAKSSSERMFEMYIKNVLRRNRLYYLQHLRPSHHIDIWYEDMMKRLFWSEPKSRFDLDGGLFFFDQCNDWFGEK